VNVLLNQQPFCFRICYVVPDLREFSSWRWHGCLLDFCVASNERTTFERLLTRSIVGRAGRKGKDEIGESYVCCEKADLEEVVQLLDADLPSVESSLTPEQRGLKR